MEQKCTFKEDGIKAVLIADSISQTGKRISTFELHYPRFIHAEFMTHRAFSRNASSSRAIPVNKMMDYIKESPATPVEWGLNQPGMQSKGSLDSDLADEANSLWLKSCYNALEIATQMQEINLHKQVANRITEPYQYINVLCTATEFDNFFNLRIHKDAQPEIQVLAKKMHTLLKESQPELLHAGEWHTPYVPHHRSDSGELLYGKVIGENETEFGTDYNKALKVSGSCCAQVSYRSLDDSYDRAEKIFDKLINSHPVHASPVEHQAKPMNSLIGDFDMLEPGITHISNKKEMCSSNFIGWIQYRQLISNHVCTSYK